MKTLTKRKSLMGFIYALIMLLPFSAILLRCLYVVINDNAYKSYSGVNASETQYSYLEVGDTIDSTTIYYLDLNKYTQPINNSQVYITNVNVVNQGQLSNANVNHLENYDDYRCLSYGGQNKIEFYGLQNGSSTWLFSFNPLNEKFTISFNIVNVSSGLDWWLPLLYTFSGSPLYYVDNAFDYSLYTFLNENGTGRLNLTDWFTDTFLNRTTHNMLYLNYVNWYMNYSLLVSCVYLLYSVLMWFLTFARYIINKPLKEEE